ncbi:baseplate J/gp47 family protein [Clostridium thermopalmarium]|uniref:Baseplate J-like protein n=1 Tax=Clostridium thermopalmarium DSM 5974 TaxID=1121340 RepID=A0A2T0API8_9CLOT|nr:baseplate J/gp47 family protein [Clostridium thermopalmarium]PRR70929.1 Baseplate J-like protein [Clostridium thermopalmarium DSM 5974]PVZ28853.1 putative phage protein gp47/JayE [Clostridium thermopalmarium DSM 5974]
MYSEDSKDILNRMLDKVPNDLNKLEGSFLFDALSPISCELAEAKIQLDEILNRVFAVTAAKYGYSEELDKKAEEYGIYRKGGTKATGEIIFDGVDNTVIPKGTIVQTSNGLQFETTEEKIIINGSATVKIEAMEIGEKYNVPSGTITQLPIQLVGIRSINNINPTTGGTENESDAELLQRLLLKIQSPVTSGNPNHYKQWALEVDGVGKVKVFPLYDGNGTVKIVLIDSNKKAPSEELINNVFNHIEDVRPIGPKITVVGGIEKQINITSKVILANGFNIGQVQEEFIKLLDEYLKDIAFELSYVSIARIGNLLLNTPGVLDYTELKINNFSVNVGLSDEEIPVLGTVSLEVQ